MSGNTPNRLELLPSLMLSSLPPDSSPHLRDPYDAVALFTHAAMLSVDFRLTGLGEDHTIPAEVSSGTATKPLPTEWNATANSSYAFRYKHAQSSLDFLVKVSRLGKKTVVHALAVDDDKVHSFDIATQDFMSASSFPYTAPLLPPPTAEQARTDPAATANEGEDGDATGQGEGNGDGTRASRTKSLVDLFISPGRLGDLWALFKINIVQKIAPGLSAKGPSEDDVDAQRQAEDETRTHPPGRAPAPAPAPQHEHDDPLRDARLPPAAYPRPPFPHGDGDPLAPEQARPRPHGDLQPPGWDDEYDVLRAPGRAGVGGGGGVGGYRPRPNLGERDLYPQGLGPNDPFRPFGPGLGAGGGFGGGGMHPTHDDFFPPGGRFGEDEEGGSGGGDPLRAPRGARFDPPFPGMGPPRGSGGGFGGPGGFGGGGFGGPGGFGGGII